MSVRSTSRIRVVRPAESFDPPPAAHREVVSARPLLDESTSARGEDSAAPPVLLVPGLGHGAWIFTEHWLDQIASRGFPAHAMSLRGHGTSDPAPAADLRAYAHDVVQVAAALPNQAVLVGHGVGALVVALAMARYPVRAGVLVAPVFGGPGLAMTVLRQCPVGGVTGLLRGTVRLGRGQLLSAELADAAAREYVARLAGGSRRVQWQLIRAQRPEPAVGNPPVLVLGSPDDRIVSATALSRVARRYGGAPLLFPGMGHDLPLDVRWREPVDAICDWLAKSA